MVLSVRSINNMRHAKEHKTYLQKSQRRRNSRKVNVTGVVMKGHNYVSCLSDSASSVVEKTISIIIIFLAYTLLLLKGYRSSVRSHVISKVIGHHFIVCHGIIPATVPIIFSINIK